MTLPSDDELVQRWMLFLDAAKRSRLTVEQRRRYLERFAEHLDGRGLLSATHPDLVGFLTAHQWAVETQRSARATLRTFYAWALDEDLLDHDPSRRLPSIMVAHSIPRPIPDDELAAAEARMDTETLVMSRLMSHAGLRRAEVARVHRDDITTLGLRVTGKGRRTRLIPVHPRLAEVLIPWAGAADLGWLFPGRFPDTPASPDYIASRLERVLPDGYTCHKLRHRFASKAYNGTRDLFAVQQLLGHSQPETTARYVLIPQDSLRAAVHSIE